MFREFHAQTRGRGHAADGVPCQDRTAYGSRAGVQVMCLSDGAGSAAHSEHGAQALVDEGVRMLAARFTDIIGSRDGAQVKLDLVQGLQRRLSEVAARRGCATRDLAATFLAVATFEDRFLAVHVGDGVIGFVRNGELKVVSAPDNDEFANRTTFVTSSGAAASMRLLRGSLDGVSGFVLMSDGSAESLFNHRTGRLASACAKVIALVGDAPQRQVRHPAHKKQLRRFLETRLRGATKDDCSIGILGRRLPSPVDRGPAWPTAALARRP